MSNKARLIRNSLWAVSGTVLNNLFSLVVLAILARSLTPHEFGLVAFAALFIEISSGVMLSGLPDALAREKSWDDRLASSAFWANCGIGLAFLLVTAAIAPLLAERPALILLALAPTFLIEAASGVADARMRFDLRFKGLAARQVAGTIAGGLAAIGVLMAGGGIWALVAQRLVAALAQSVLLWAVVRWRPQFTFSMAHLRPAIRYSMHMMGVNALSQINFRAVDILIGAIAGPAALGVYQIAGRFLNMLVQTTVAPIQRVAMVSFAKLHDSDAIGRAYVRTTRLVGLATFPAFLGMAAVARDFIPVLVGPQWGEASIVLIFMSLIVLPYTLTYFSAPALAAAGHSAPLLRYNVLMTASTIAAATLSAPFGVIWVAAAHSLRANLMLPAALGVVGKHLNVSARSALAGLAAPGLCAAAMALLVGVGGPVVLAGLSPLARLPILVAAGALIYLLLMATFGRAALAEALSEGASLVPARLARFLPRPRDG